MKKLSKLLITLLFFLLTGCILTHSQLSLFYALTGLNLWYEKMVPALLPFMILSGIMIRLRLTKGFTTALYPVIHPIFRVSRNVCYAIIMGFLCGFPMGARTVADLYERQMITKREGEYLLAFCNNIGPVYFLSFVLPLIGRQLILPYLLGMYGLPFLYGIILRYTTFRDLSADGTAVKASVPLGKMTLLGEMDDAIHSSVQNILMLGGYMILFNLLNLVPHILLGEVPQILSPLFEISGGLKFLGDSAPLYTLLVLPFGGLSCIAQTYSCIKKTPLSITAYTFHKMFLTVLTAAYYLCWWVLLPSAFLC
ncbi:MAG: hypothetical protein J1E64_09365 [Acetatifactor sp.]|nr:hypothetical protein [Acetatifactor sp.]